MENLIDYFSKIDVSTLLAIAAMFWIFKIHLDKKFDKIDKQFEKVDQRFDKISDEVKDIDRRLCRIEGSMVSKECCMLSNDRQNKKAE